MKIAPGEGILWIYFWTETERKRSDIVDGALIVLQDIQENRCVCVWKRISHLFQANAGVYAEWQEEARPELEKSPFELSQ